MSGTAISNPPGDQKKKHKKRKRESNIAGSLAKRPRGDGEDGHDGTNGALKGHGKVQSQRSGLSKPTDANASDWQVSKPMGGRMLDIDPILSEDEQYLILTYNTSLQVFSTAGSLLVRRISIPTASSTKAKGPKASTIVATHQSRQNPDTVWVACSDGSIFHIDWTQSSEVKQVFRTNSGTAKALTVLPVELTKTAHEVVLVVESEKSHKLELVAYSKSNSTPKSIFTLKKSGSGLQLVSSTQDGRVLIGALNDRLFVGVASSNGIESLDQLSYEFFSFDCPDVVTTLDLKVDRRKQSSSTARKNRQSEFENTVDVLVGGARGGIYLYQDIVSRLQAQGEVKSEKDHFQAQKYHWHRKAVHAVKWSRDGNYMISGGSENTLVIWQMDTSKKDFLPHLSGSIENIVVSASGASYAVQLDDNTALVLSTSEMKPTAYVTGMQSSVSNLSPPKDLLVQRVWTTPEHVRQPIPAAIQPGDLSKLHICVGNGRQATMSGQISAPLLQSVDLETFTSTMTQPLARTQPTDVNITNKGVPIDEPLVTHIAFSADGRWLASIDEWKPSEKDVENISSEMREQFVRERYEVYLKFWEMDSESGSAALVSRINAPHATTQPETILDLATNPVASCFATIGSDGLVRLWQPKVRQQDGIVIKGAKGQDATSWSCTQVIAISDGLSKEAAVDVVHSSRPTKRQGSITFSEDGSMIVVAFGAVDTGIIYIIDATSGEVIKTIESLWSGQLHSVKTLSPFIVILSDELRVYDVVGDELRFGIDLPQRSESNDLLQLAVDHKSRHFAIALPIGSRSSIGIFSPEDADPLLVHTLPHHVVSLISSPDTSGFMIVDDAAQVWTVSEVSNPKSLAALQPLEDMRLDKVETEPANGLNGISNLLDDDTNMASDGEDDDGEADIGKDGDIDMDDDDDDEVHASVVAPQHLAEIFDAAPAFAAPSIEDMFYKVTGLLGGKPLAVTMEQ